MAHAMHTKSVGIALRQVYSTMYMFSGSLEGDPTSCALLRIFPSMLLLSWWDSDGTYRVILRIVKAGCHPVAIAQVVEH